MKHCEYCKDNFELENDHWRKHSGGRVSCKIKARDKRRKTQLEKNLKKYGTEKPLNDTGYQLYLQVRRLETLRKKYGADNAMQVEEFKARHRESRKASLGGNSPKTSTITTENRLKAAEKKNNKYSDILSGNKTLKELCEGMGINPEWAYREFQAGGEDQLAQALYEFKFNSLNAEGQFVKTIRQLEISAYNKKAITGGNYVPDFYLSGPNGDLCIKIDSLYWDSSAMNPESNNNELRQSLKDAGHRLLQFRAHEISRKGEIIKNIVANYIKHDINKRVSLSNCIVYDISANMAGDFLRENHLHGPHLAAKGYGVFADKELVAVMAVRVREKCAYIERLACKNGHSLNKLHKFVAIWCQKNLNCKTIVAYCDLRYEDPQDFEDAGFESIKTWTDWVWTNGIDVFAKSKCRAKMDDRLLPERAYAAEMGLKKIYDAGKIKFMMVNRRK